MAESLQPHLAIYLAQEARRCVKEIRKWRATLCSTPRCTRLSPTFLQDSLASGHQMVRRGFSASAVSNNKSLHDFYNTIPVQTANLKGETWSAYGDKRLNQNMMEYNEADDYRHIRVTEKHPYSLEKGDSYERETKVFYQVVTATCQSIGRSLESLPECFGRGGENILNEIPSERDDLPQFVYDRFPVIKDFPIPFRDGSG